MSFSIASDDVWNDDWYSVDEQGEWRGVSFEDLEVGSGLIGNRVLGTVVICVESQFCRS